MRWLRVVAERGLCVGTAVFVVQADLTVKICGWRAVPASAIRSAACRGCQAPQGTNYKNGLTLLLRYLIYPFASRPCQVTSTTITLRQPVPGGDFELDITGTMAQVGVEQQGWDTQQCTWVRGTQTVVHSGGCVAGATLHPCAGEWTGRRNG